MSYLRIYFFLQTWSDDEECVLDFLNRSTELKMFETPALHIQKLIIGTNTYKITDVTKVSDFWSDLNTLLPIRTTWFGKFNGHFGMRAAML